MFLLIFFHFTLHYNINSLITNSTCNDKYQTNYKFKIQIINKKENIQHKTQATKLFIRKESEAKDEKLITLKCKK